jgi:hypothetical protein
MPQQIWTLWKRKGLRRGIVVVFIVAAAAVLTKVLPVNKALPCPWCTISSLIGWMYFMSCEHERYCERSAAPLA